MSHGPHHETTNDDRVFCVYYNEDEGGRKVGGVSVMKHKELKLEEIEGSHTLGGEGEGRVQGRVKTCLL